MNIQIFGTKKCNDTKKAERFFKERGIKYQFIDMKEKGMSKGEFTSVAQANGGIENMINWEGKDQDTLALIKYIADEDKLEKILENPSVIKTPVAAYQSSVPSASAKGATAATVAPPRPKPPLFSAVQDCTIAFAWSAVTA